jgi:membrane fusion protein
MSVTRRELFRPESIQARQMVWVGRHTLALGVPAKFSSFSSVLLIAAAIALLLYGSYARRVELHGVVLPAAGLIQVSASVTGFVQRMDVHDGQQVAKGDSLYVINQDTSTTNGDTQQKILESLAYQRQTLVTQISRKMRLEVEQREDFQRRIDNVKDQIQQTSAQVAMKDEFVRKLTKDFGDYAGYVKSGIGNINERQVQQAAWMRSKDELEELKAAVLKERGQLIELQLQQADAGFANDYEIDVLRTKIAEIDQQVASAEARRAIEIRAPGAGTVTAIASNPGQTVASGARMLTLIPDQKAMRAELLAPSTSIGFIRPGQRVLLRYSAFPYQKFGQYWGTVIEVSHAALQQEELKSLVPTLAPSDQSKTFYRVIVAPDRQDVTAYGRLEPLQASMQVEARVLLENRAIYQWILEPVYGLTGLRRS